MQVMRSATLTAFLLASFSLPALCQNTYRMTKLEYSVTERGSGLSRQSFQNTMTRVVYIASDGRMFTEDIDPRTGKMVDGSIEIPSEDVFIQLNPATKVATESVGGRSDIASGRPVPGAASAPIPANRRVLGNVTVDGFACKEYRNEVPGKAWMQVSLCRDPSFGQTFIGNMEGGGASNQVAWQQTLVKATPNLPVRQTLFEIPPGYKVVKEH